MIYGVLRPVILLPPSMIHGDPQCLHFVLSHELEHIRHFDIIWKWISAAVLCLFWFNPAIWVMHILLTRDIELHCDECVIRKLGMTQKNKSRYAMTLLDLAEEKNRAFPLACHFSQNATEARLQSIMHTHKASTVLIRIVLLGITILAFLSFASFVMDSGIMFTVPIS